jgi:hypothetical protein
MPSVVQKAETPNAQILEIISRVAMDPAADISKMERLLALYREIESLNAERAFNEALQAVQTEMPRILRDAYNEQTKSAYARLETINDALVPVYTRHGFSLSFSTGHTDMADHLLVTCRVSHSAGHSRDYEYPSPIITAGIKGNTNMTRTHASGSALSYGRRYLTLLIFNATLTNDKQDDDGNGASEKIEVVTIGAVRMRKIVDGMLQAVQLEDGPGLLQIVDELTTEEQLIVWNEFRSWERSDIKKLLHAARSVAEPHQDTNEETSNDA